MDAATRAGAARWVGSFFFLVLIAALVFACVRAPLAPRPGARQSDALARIAVPGGFVDAAGGNFSHARQDLLIDTRLGPLALGATHNSSGGWIWHFEPTYQGGVLRDESGAEHALAALPSGAAAPGTHWVRLDETRVKTKGGLLHEFDPATGRLAVLRWASAPYPRLRFSQRAFGASWRTAAIAQCTSASACTELATLEHDTSGLLLRVRDHAGRVAEYGYDAAGQLRVARDAHDRASGLPGTRYEYAGSRLSAIVSSDGERVEIESDAAGRTLAVRAIGEGDPTWRFEYAAPDAAGQYLTTARDPLGNATSYTLDAARALRSHSNALGEMTRYEWSASRLATIERPDGTRTTYTIVDDEVVAESQPSGNVVTTSYEPNGVDRERPRARPIARIADALGVRETRSYDGAGRLLSTANGAGETTTLDYAADEALASVRAPDGATLQLRGYGLHGHASQLSLDGATWASAAYDALGNPRAAAWPEPTSGGVVRVAFDADRNPAGLELQDAPESGAPSVRTLAIERRADGRPLRVLRPYGGEARFAYDALGRLASLAERASPDETPSFAAFAATTWTRDLAGRVTALERANGMREELSYDAAGRVVRWRSLRAGVVETDVRFELARGRLVRSHDAISGFEERYGYDAAGRLAEVTHALGEKTRYAYDARSRLVRTEFLMPGDVPLAALTHGYDAAGRETRLGHLGADLLALTFVNGAHEQTRYGNGLRRLQFRDRSAGRTSGRELWRSGTRLEKSSYAFRDGSFGELLQMRSEVAGLGTTQEDFGWASAAGMDRRIAGTAVSSPLAITSERFAYDHLSNLSGAVVTAPGPLGTPSTTATRLVYNAEHNRVLRAERSNGLTPSTAYAYDAAGFVTLQTARIGTSRFESHFDWNALGQIRSIATNGALDASFVYDALGRRRERFANGVLTRWRFAGVVEADASDRPVAIDLGAVRIQLDGAHRYRHADGRGNAKLVSDAAGAVVAHAAFSAYGRSAVLGSASDDARFAGGEAVAVGVVRLFALGQRLYDPALARFLAPDPLWSPLNQYAYTLGNPVDFWDASGMHAGRHTGLVSAGIDVASRLLGVGLAVVAFAVAATPTASAIAVVGGALAILSLAQGMAEFQEQLQQHREETEAEGRGREGSAPSGGGGASGDSLGGGFSGGSGGRVFELRPEPTRVVCATDFSGTRCSRSGANISISHHLWLY